MLLSLSPSSPPPPKAPGFLSPAPSPPARLPGVVLARAQLRCLDARCASCTLCCTACHSLPPPTIATALSQFNLEGKTTAWQYYSTLKRLTSNVFADTVPDRYRELMRALRQWRDLSSRRRAGHPLDPSVQLKPGDLALFCPACPQPGINLRDDWHEDKDQLV